MKKIIFSLLFGLIAFVGFSQELKKVKTDDVSKGWGVPTGNNTQADTVKLNSYNINLTNIEIRQCSSCFIQLAGQQVNKDDRAAYIAVENILATGNTSKTFNGNVSRKLAKCIIDNASSRYFSGFDIRSKKNLDSLGKVLDTRIKIRDKILQNETNVNISKRNSIVENRD